MKYTNMQTKLALLAVCIGLAAPVTQAQGWGESSDDAGWKEPSDNSAAWGASKKSLDPTSPQNARKLDKEQRDPIQKNIPSTPVANPFDASGVYMGETQTLTGTGVDPASGMTVPDAPVITEQ